MIVAIRSGSSPTGCQRWFVARCTTTSPGPTTTLASGRWSSTDPLSTTPTSIVAVVCQLGRRCSRQVGARRCRAWCRRRPLRPATGRSDHPPWSTAVTGPPVSHTSVRAEEPDGSTGFAPHAVCGALLQEGVTRGEHDLGAVLHLHVERTVEDHVQVEGGRRAPRRHVVALRQLDDLDRGAAGRERDGRSVGGDAVSGDVGGPSSRRIRQIRAPGTSRRSRGPSDRKIGRPRS